MKFYQLNLHKSPVPTAHLNDILNSVNGHHDHISFIQEPYVFPSSPARIQGFNFNHSVFQSPSVTRPSSGIITSSALASRSSLLLPFTSSHVVAIKVDIDASISVVACSVYWHPLAKDIPPEFIDLLEWCHLNNLPIIWGGDVNAKHIAWGSKTTDSRRKVLLDLINCHGLVILNTGNSPTWSNVSSNSVIDISVCSPSLLNSIQDWKVGQSDCHSDHELLSFSSSLTAPSPMKKVRVSDSSLDFDHLSDALKLSVGRLNFSSPAKDADELNCKAEVLNDLISAAIKDSSTEVYFKRKNLEGIDQSLEEKKLKKEKHSLLKKFRRNRNDANFKAYKKVWKQFKKKKSEKRNMDWKGFTSNCSSKQAAKLLKDLEKSENVKIKGKPCISTREGIPIAKNKDALKYLVDTLAPGIDLSAPSSSTVTSLPTEISVEEQISIFRTAVDITSNSRMAEVIKGVKVSSCSGPDDISYKVLSHCWDTVSPALQFIFRDCITLGILPEGWLMAEGIFLKKPDKPDYTNPKAFRMINLAPCVLKVFERLMKWHLEIDLGLDFFLHFQQFGFRKGSSCDDALHNLCATIEKALIGKKIVLGIFLDISGAFDNVNKDFILASLSSFTSSKLVYRIIEFYLNNRRVRFKLGDDVLIRLILLGFPQGGILSPLLWNLVLDPLLKRVNLVELLQAFADDLALLIVGDSIEDCRMRADRMLRLIEQWCVDSGLTINAAKSRIVIFTDRHKISLNSPITCQGAIIPVTKEVRYLGVILDSHLHWHSHLKSKRSQVIAQQARYAKAIGRHWGLNANTTAWIYKAVVKPRLLYGAHVWANSLTRFAVNASCLSSVQSVANRSITGTSRSIPNLVSGVLANTDSIISSAIAKSVSTMARIQTSVEDQCSDIKGKLSTHTSFAISMSNQVSEDVQVELDRNIDVFCNIDRNFSVNTQPDDSDVISIGGESIYTDGSKINGQIGAGYVHITESQEISRCWRMPDHCSVFQAEISAIHTAAEECRSTQANIVFFSDSQSALGALTVHFPKSRTVSDCISSLNELGLHNTVSLRWVKAHCGIEGNEKADKLAKAGAHLADSEIFLDTPLPYSLFKKQISNWAHLQTHRQFQESSSSNRLHKFLLNIHSSSSLSKAMLGKLTRSDLHKLSAIVGNRAPLNVFLLKISHCGLQVLQHGDRGQCSYSLLVPPSVPNQRKDLWSPSDFNWNIKQYSFYKSSQIY